MRINFDNETVDLERRDVNYILPQYIRSYLFFTKGKDPKEIVFPMFSSVPHPQKRGMMVPIRWVPELGPDAMEIEVDGGNVPEATEEQVKEADDRDETIRKLKEQIEALKAGAPPETVASAPETLADVADTAPTPPTRQPRQPERPATGRPDNMHPRGRGDLKAVREALADQPEISEEEEKPFGKTVRRGSKGEPIVE